MENNYEASSIRELKYPDNCRQKIGMYLGDASIGGFNHTFIEILDNSIDEFVAGHGNKIEIKIKYSKIICSNFETQKSQ